MMRNIIKKILFRKRGGGSFQETINLLYAEKYRINDNIALKIPTVGEILDSEQDYYSLVALISATPYEMMVQLDDIGIDFTKITEFELFCILSAKLAELDVSMIFEGFSFRGFRPAKNEQNGDLVLLHGERGIIYDRAIHHKVCRALRKIHFLPKEKGVPGNDEARKFMIERMRIKQQRAQAKNQSQLEPLIVSMVCTEQYKYGFADTRAMSIYQFNSCVRQIIRKVSFDNLMIGCYAGTVDTKKINQRELNWLAQK